jgi:hypothetical protein
MARMRLSIDTIVRLHSETHIYAVENGFLLFSGTYAWNTEDAAPFLS